MKSYILWTSVALLSAWIMVSVVPILSAMTINILLLVGLLYLIGEQSSAARYIVLVGGLVVDSIASPYLGVITVSTLIALGVTGGIMRWYDNRDVLQSALIAVGSVSVYYAVMRVAVLAHSWWTRAGGVSQPPVPADFWVHRMIEISIVFILVIVVQVVFSRTPRISRA